MENKFRSKALNIVFAWERNYKKSLFETDRNGLVEIIEENLVKIAWESQQPNAKMIPNPKS